MKPSHLLALLALCASGCTADTPQTASLPSSTSKPDASKSEASKPRAATTTALDDYVARPEPAYKWEVVSRPEGKTGRYELSLTSQEWHGTTWKHKVELFVPETNALPGRALLSISYGRGTPQEAFFGQVVANLTGAVFINVFNVPNQPLFEAREDGLIALTFDKYLQSGDATWPLLLPMTKSATQAMRAAEEFSRRELEAPLKNFAVTGASKRGWTSYLVAAADAKLHPGRVIGIAPFVYNNLNIPAQLTHQRQTWGEFSPRIADYTRRDLPAKMASQEGGKLVELVDPYFYRERLTMPKLLVHASNDEYWNLDGFDFYGAQIPGPTVLYQAPNVGHLMTGEEARAAGTMGQWFKMVASGKPVPTLSLVRHSATELSLNATATRGQDTRRIWVARSASRDFRNSKWTAVAPAKPKPKEPTEHSEHAQQEAFGTGTKFEIPPAPADKPYTAIFGEVEIPGDPLPLVLSTPPQIWGPSSPTTGQATEVAGKHDTKPAFAG